jgi:hypothetical protein
MISIEYRKVQGKLAITFLWYMQYAITAFAAISMFEEILSVSVSSVL